MKTLQITGILFFVALLIFQAGMGFVVYMQQQAARMEVKQKYLEGFVGDELILLAIPLTLENNTNNVFRRIHSKEFVYLGQMYDIVEQQRIGNETWYLVYPDMKETGLKKKLKLLMDNYDSEKQKNHTGIKVLNQLVFLQQQFLFQHQIFLKQSLTLLDYYQFSIKDWLKKPFSPPPRWIL